MRRPGFGNVRLPEAELDLELEGLREEGALQLRARHLRWCRVSEDAISVADPDPGSGAFFVPGIRDR